MGTKLCPHSITPVAELRQMIEAGCPLIKLVDDFGPAAEFQPQYPNLIIIGRVTEGAEYDPVTLYRQGWSYQAAAQAQVDRQTQKYQLNPAVRIWEGPNEPAFGDGNDPANQAAIAWYGNYEAYRLGLLAAMGLRGVVGNFSTGSPDLPAADPMVMWRNFLPALRAAQQYNGFLGLHEYSSPWMWYWYGKYQLANCPDFQGPISEGDTGWLTFRYRKVYRDLLQGQGLGNLPLAITEFGLDRVGQGCPGTDMPAGAWKDLTDWWRNRWDGAPDPIDYWRGPERDPERYYAEQLIWADGELRRDSFVAGACIFTFGHAGNPIWERFEISGSRITGILTDYIRGLPLFNDVPDSHWAYAYIQSLTANGITGGCGGGNYCPEDPVTRAEMAVFLLRGLYGGGYAPPPFSGVYGFADVGPNHWAAAWIEQLYSEGVTGGCAQNPLRYCPEDRVTRAQMAVFLLRSRHGPHYQPPAPGGLFSDVPTDYWAAGWIEQLAAEGITGGCGGGRYCPDQPVTRAEMAVFLVRTFNLPLGGACTDDSAFVADVTIPDGTVFAPDVPFTKIWRLRNSGGCGWNRSYLLVHIGGPLMDALPSVPLPGVVSPAQEVDIAVDFLSPPDPGTYRSQWQIQRPDGVRFGTRPYVEIMVAT